MMKRFRYHPRGQAGFTLIEVLLAIVVIVGTAIVGSRTLLDSTKLMNRLHRQKQASNLSGMIFQQYQAYAAQNFQILSIYNSTSQSPKQFFNKADNFGFDGLSITTVATYAENRSTCTVTATVNWTEGGNLKSASYKKTLSPTNQMGVGGALQVWVMLPCSGYTADQDIIAHCTPLSGFSLSATAATPGGSPILGITGPDGSVLLKNVQLGGSVPLTVTAPNTNYSYYTLDQTGSYVATISTFATVIQANLNTKVITRFLPLGQVVGRLINDDTLNANPPVSGLQVSLGGNAVMMSSGSFTPCGTSGCIAITDANGRYEFDNVVPKGLTVTGIGRQGSDPMVQTSSTGFVQGYTNPVPVTMNSSDWTTAPLSGPIGISPALQIQDIHVKALGTVILTAIDSLTNLPIPGATFYVGLPPTPFRGVLSYYLTWLTNAAGQVTLNNVFSNDSGALSNAIYIVGFRNPQSGDHGYYASQYGFCPGVCVGTSVTLPITFTHTYLLNGQYHDDNPNGALYAGGQASVSNYSTYQSLMIAVDGTFSVDQFHASNDPTTPFNSVTYINGPQSGNYILTVHNRDNSTGNPAPYAINVFNAASNQMFMSDANGDYTYTGGFGYYNSIPATFQCENVNFTCSMCPYANPALPCPVVTAVHFDSTNNQLGINDTTLKNGWVHGNQMFAAQQNVPMDVTVPNWLKSISVKGTITTGGAPLAGISVTDATGAVIGITDANGFYSGWANVTGGTTPNKQCDIVVLAGQVINGITYQPTRSPIISLASPIDPTTPITQDLYLLPLGAGGGGGV